MHTSVVCNRVSIISLDFYRSISHLSSNNRNRTRTLSRYLLMNVIKTFHVCGTKLFGATWDKLQKIPVLDHKTGALPRGQSAFSPAKTFKQISLSLYLSRKEIFKFFLSVRQHFRQTKLKVTRSSGTSFLIDEKTKKPAGQKLVTFTRVICYRTLQKGSRKENQTG